MKKYLQKITVGALILCFLCTGCASKSRVHHSMDTAMGTIINQTIYVSGGMGTAETISGEILSCIETLEKEQLSWRLESSLLYQVNASAGSSEAFPLGSLLGEVLEQCKKVYAASDGAFDFSIGRVARLWNIDEWAAVNGDGESISFVPPTDAQLAEALAFVGGDRSVVEGEYVRLPKGMQLDLGAVGKGIALDEIKKLLEQREEVTGAVISVGGSILTYGSKPEGGTWTVGIVNPHDTAQSLGTLRLTGQWCISTSGDYERFIEVDGIRYHHILDPRTGHPADSGIRSVTILTKDGLLSDALSTACFVLGVEEGLALAEQFQAQALLVDTQGDIHMTTGMEQYFYLSNSEK